MTPATTASAAVIRNVGRQPAAAPTKPPMSG
jgi:hypothetical protein